MFILLLFLLCLCKSNNIFLNRKIFRSKNDQKNRPHDFCYVVSTKFVKRLEKTEFYEMRVSVGNNEFRTVLFAIDADNFMECHRMVMLNSFVEKGTKQYSAEIKKAERLLTQL